MRIEILRYRARNIIMLMRPQFLVASVVLFFIGMLAVGDFDDILSAPMFAAAVAIVLVQLSSHLINEYTDWEGDRFARRSFFAGGSGVLSTGKESPSAALSIAIVSGAMIVALGIFVDAELDGRTLFLPVLLIATVLSWSYSLRPIRLMDRGIGEFVVTGLLAWGVPMLAGYLVTEGWPSAMLPYSIILSFFGLAALIGVEFPDKQADIRSGKRNLTYRFGVRRMAQVQFVLVFSGYAATVVLILMGQIGWVNILILATLIYGWAAVTLMVLSRHYSYEWARASTTVMISIFVIGMLLALIDVAVL